MDKYVKMYVEKYSLLQCHLPSSSAGCGGGGTFVSNAVARVWVAPRAPQAPPHVAPWELIDGAVSYDNYEGVLATE